MTVPVVLHIIYDLEPAGPECRLLTLGRRLPAGSTLVCVTSRRLGLLKDFKRAGIPVLVLPVVKAYLAFGAIWMIFRYARMRKVVLVSVYDVKGLVLARALRWLSCGGIRTVYNHVTAIKDMAGRQAFLLPRLLRGVDRVVCNSRFSLGEMTAIVGGDRGSLIYNGVDTELFCRRQEERIDARRLFAFAAGDTVLGIVAGFRPVKDYPFLLAGFARLAARSPQIRLLCVGDGPEREGMQALAGKLGVGDRVVFAGQRLDVAFCLQAMDIFVLTSRWEGLPNAILEAMSSGLPVVASKVGGCAEVVAEGQTGWLYEAGDAAMFDLCLGRLLDDPRQAADMGAAARTATLEKFSLDAMVAVYAAFFSSMAG